jgi:hypothetical protein
VWPPLEQGFGQTEDGKCSNSGAIFAVFGGLSKVFARAQDFSRLFI